MPYTILVISRTLKSDLNGLPKPTNRRLFKAPMIAPQNCRSTNVVDVVCLTSKLANPLMDEELSLRRAVRRGVEAQVIQPCTAVELRVGSLDLPWVRGIAAVDGLQDDQTGDILRRLGWAEIATPPAQHDGVAVVPDVEDVECDWFLAALAGDERSTRGEGWSSQWNVVRAALVDEGVDSAGIVVKVGSEGSRSKFDAEGFIDEMLEIGSDESSIIGAHALCGEDASKNGDAGEDLGTHLCCMGMEKALQWSAAQRTSR